MSLQRPGLTEVDSKLRDDFRRGLREYGIEGDISDPILSIMLRSVAARIAQVYAETDVIQLQLLDELISRISLERRAARAAQGIVQFFSQDDAPVRVEAGTELLGESGTGDRLTFTTDVGMVVSGAQVALGCVYAGGQLRLLKALEMPDEFRAARPSFDPIPVACGPASALYLAFDNLPDTHLSYHGLSFFLTPNAQCMPAVLASEPWCLARSDGSFAATGLLRPKRGNAGVQVLESVADEKSDSAAERAESVPELLNGFYQKRAFVFGGLPSAFHALCLLPRGLEVAVPKLFAEGGTALFRKARAWIRIFLPENSVDAEREVQDIRLNAVSVSNIECLNQTIYFAQRGRSIPVSREAGASKYLIQPLSIVGESGPYIPSFSPSLNPRIGRFSISGGYLKLTAGRNADDRLDEYVNLRLWMTDGERGNDMPAGSIQSFLRTPKAGQLTVMSVTGAAGGRNPEQFSEACDRFAYALLSRDRVITRADLRAACRAFDSRIVASRISPSMRRTANGLERVHRVWVSVDSLRFTDLARERVLLEEELQQFLSERTLLDVPIEVEVQAAG